MKRFMDKVDKRERKFDAVCAYAYALLDTNESGRLSHPEFRTFIKNIMAKRTRVDLQDCCAVGGEEEEEQQQQQQLGGDSGSNPLAVGSKIHPTTTTTTTGLRAAAVLGGTFGGASINGAARIWGAKAKLKVNDNQRQEEELVDSVFDVITFDPNAPDDLPPGSRAGPPHHHSPSERVKTMAIRRMSLAAGANKANKATPTTAAAAAFGHPGVRQRRLGGAHVEVHVPLQKFIHIIKKWNAFRQHYTVKELAVALQFFVSGQQQAQAASARSVANRLWFGKYLFGASGRARLAVQAFIAHPVFVWATTSLCIFYVPLLGFTVSVREHAPGTTVLGANATTRLGEPALTWGEAVNWTE